MTAINARDNITFLPSILPPRDTFGDDSAAARPSVQHDEAGIDLHANLVDYGELEIAKALARHLVEIGLPKHYAPNHVVLEGKMRVVGIKAKTIIDESCHDCEIHFTAILEKCADADVLHKPRTKD